MKVAKPDRQSEWLNPDKVNRDGFVLSDRHGAGTVAPHAHLKDQLIHAAEGVLTVKTNTGLWVVPPHRAVWMPARIIHSVSSRRAHRLLTLYIRPGIISISERPAVVNVGHLVSELLEAGAEVGVDYRLGGPEERLIRVLLDRLSSLKTTPLHLPEPTSEVLRQISSELKNNPSDGRTLLQFCKQLGMGERTAARRFTAETGMTFGRWRQQLRLLSALERLAAGDAATAVALDVGYQDASSFISTFKRALGTTPAKYFSTT